MDLGDPVLEGCPFDFTLYLAITEDAFQGDELPFPEGLGELREIPPGVALHLNLKILKMALVYCT